MATAKEYSNNIQREVNIDIEALLEAIETRSSGEVEKRQASGEHHHIWVDGREYRSYTELADAFELDIRYFLVTETH